MKNLFEDMQQIYPVEKTFEEEPTFQFKRLEKKFLLNAPTAEILKAQIGFYIPKDEKASKSPYISSTYLENSTWKCYTDQVIKIDPRFKIRFREYNKTRDLTGEGFWEIKKKSNSVSVKDRFKSNIKIFDSAWKFSIPDEVLMLNYKLGIDKLSEIYFSISEAVIQYKLIPIVRVSYLRETFESKDKSLRVTFDSDLEFEYVPNNFALPVKYSHKMPDELRVMEIKYAGSIPAWLESCIKFNKVTKQRFSKYVTSIMSLYEPQNGNIQSEIFQFKNGKQLLDYGNFQSINFNSAQL